MGSFGTSNEKEKELHRKMRRLGIFENDIKESFIRSSGPGGQNVNKVSTCVVLRHLPTGVQVRSQQERSQGLNRYKARYLLVKKIEQIRETKRKKIIHERAKEQRQKRKRSRAAKERMLENKHKKAEKKDARRKIKIHKMEEYL